MVHTNIPKQRDEELYFAVQAFSSTEVNKAYSLSRLTYIGFIRIKSLDFYYVV